MGGALPQDHRNSQIFFHGNDFVLGTLIFPPSMLIVEQLFLQHTTQVAVKEHTHWSSLRSGALVKGLKQKPKNLILEFHQL